MKGKLLVVAIVMVVLSLVWTFNVRAEEAVTTNSVCVPPSLMLHVTDGNILTSQVIPWIESNDYETITYADYLAQLDGQKVKGEKQIILSIDDVRTTYIQYGFVYMVEALHRHGMVAALGINPINTADQTPETYATLKKWKEWGMELDNHTLSHAYLPNGGEPFIDWQVGTASGLIGQGTGTNPLVLILPYGGVNDNSGERDSQIFTSAAKFGIQVVVGIAGGREVDPNSPRPLYVGRADTNQPVWQLEHWGCK